MQFNRLIHKLKINTIIDSFIIHKLKYNNDLFIILIHKLKYNNNTDAIHNALKKFSFDDKNSSYLSISPDNVKSSTIGYFYYVIYFKNIY